jgi:hypothetical protein
MIPIHPLAARHHAPCGPSQAPPIWGQEGPPAAELPVELVCAGHRSGRPSTLPAHTAGRWGRRPSNFGRMPVMPAKTNAAKLRVSIIRNRAQFLGFVEAPDRQAAEAAAAEQFNISEEWRTRLVVQERDKSVLLT